MGSNTEPSGSSTEPSGSKKEPSAVSGNSSSTQTTVWEVALKLGQSRLEQTDPEKAQNHLGQAQEDPYRTWADGTDLRQADLTSTAADSSR